MAKNPRHLVFLTLLPLLLPWTAGAGDLLTIGRPAKEVRREHERLKPIAEYLAERLEGHGIEGCDVVLDGKNSQTATAALIRSGKLDLIFETPYASLAFAGKAGAVPILLIRREGVLEYNSFIFARKDSGITTLGDLPGKVIAFEDPGSTSAYHLPRAALEAAGLRLAQLSEPEGEAPEGKVGYVFAGSELNVSSWVFFRRTAAGALSNTDWVSQDENPESFRREFTILEKTEPVPRMLVLAAPDLGESLVRAVQAVLLDMPNHETGRTALAPYRINGFVGIAEPAAYIEELAARLAHLEEPDAP